MSSLSLLVIADPAAPFVKPLSRLSEGVRAMTTRDPDALKSHAPDAEVILYACFDPHLLPPVLSLAHRVRWIHCLWTGVEDIMTNALIAHPAPLTNGRGAFRWPLADWAMAAMLVFAFDLRRVIQQQEQGVWQPVYGTSLSGRTLGIVGYGSIGSAAATRARAFGMKIAALRRRNELFQGDPLVDRNYSSGQLKELIATSDYLLVTTPLTAETRGMIGESEIAAMKPEAVLINIGRGPVVDEPALVRALESGRIRGAALDVFNTEPLPAGHPFWNMRNVLLSPHTADRVDGFLEPAFDCFFQNLERFKSGEPLQNIVDKIRGY